MTLCRILPERRGWVNMILLLSHIQLHNTYTNICGNIVNNNIRTSMNERTHFFIKNILLTLYSRKGDVSCVWEVSWRRGHTATYWPKGILTIAALLPHLGWSCSTVGLRGPQALSLQANSHAGILSPKWLQLQLELTQAICGTCLCSCLAPTSFRCSSAYSNWCISWLTARSRVKYNNIKTYRKRER